MYQINYRGKMLRETMDQEMAEGLLQQLSLCFKNLELVEIDLPIPDMLEEQVSA